MFRIRALFGIGLAAAVALPGCVAPDDEETIETDEDFTLSSAPPVASTGVCNGGRFRCYARVVTNATRSLTSAPSGLGANDLADAYKLDTSIDPHATIAIIDAFGYPKAEADLKAYRAQYGLPACTVASGCLTIVNQTGATSPLPHAPPKNNDWTVETALDLDMASAACPKCKILLVQSNNDTDDGLYIAQATAVRLGATVISNSWGTSETKSDPGSDYEHYFANLGNVGVFVASGDDGYNNDGEGPDYPSTSAYVIAVGGTRLKRSTTNARGWSEVAWSSGGSSCSISIPKPSHQRNRSCKLRAASDVAAVGDPASGPAIYNAGKWSQIGGTSAASPLVAGIYALTGHGSDGPAFSYKNPTAYWDIKSGSNGTCGVLCKAAAGWDGPTGIGSPNGAALAALQ